VYLLPNCDPNVTNALQMPHLSCHGRRGQWDYAVQGLYGLQECCCIISFDKVVELCQQVEEEVVIVSMVVLLKAAA